MRWLRRNLVVIAGLATAYFVLKWLKNTEKFYVGLDRRSGR